MAQTYQGKFVQDGRNVDYTPVAAVGAGDVVVQDGVVGVANIDIAASVKGALSIAGVFNVVKAEEAFATLGAPVYWDENGSPYNGVALSGAATATATGNTYMGSVLVAAVSTDEYVTVVLKVTIAAGAVDAAMLASWKSGNVAVAADALVIPVTHRHVSKTTGGDAEALTLANGVAGQMLTIDLVVDGGGDGTLTPTTMTGFATIVFADAGDQVTLQYIDDTVGWVIVGAAGVAAPPAITI